MIHFLPRDKAVQHAELRRMTVLEYDPGAPLAEEDRTLARKIDENQMKTIPTPIEMDDLEQLLMDFGMVDGDDEFVVRTKAQEDELALATAL